MRTQTLLCAKTMSQAPQQLQGGRKLLAVHCAPVPLGLGSHLSHQHHLKSPSGNLPAQSPDLILFSLRLCCFSLFLQGCSSYVLCLCGGKSLKRMLTSEWCPGHLGPAQHCRLTPSLLSLSPRLPLPLFPATLGHGESSPAAAQDIFP